MTISKTQLYLALTIIILIIVTSIVISIDKHQKYKSKENAYIALLDTVKSYKLKNGQIISEKQMIESSLSDLKNMNRDLYDQINQFKKETKSTKPTIFVGGTTKTDTVIVVDTFTLSIKDNRLSVNSDYKDSTLSILTTGYVDLKTDGTLVSIDKYKLSNNLRVDNLKIEMLVSEKGGNIFRAGNLTTSIKCNDKRFVVDSIVSWKDLPKQRFLKLRPGIMTGVIYDPWDNEVKLGFSAGLALTFGR